MTANFALSLINPNAAPNPNNTVYTNGATGNTLVLKFTNNFGFDLTIGGVSTGKYLQLSISENVMDEAEARILTVESPWTITFLPPSPASNQDDQARWIFHLLPPAGGVPFPNGKSITITLQNLRPSAIGTGQVAALYAFDTTPADDLNVSAAVSVLAPYNPQLATLVGPDDALVLTPYVNGGNAANPIMVSSTPVTTETAVDNLLHLNLTFQQTGNNASLVPQWDPAHPPTFRISFPYFNGNSGLPAPLDLTDTLTAQDSNYNPLTSAWNFPMTLDPTNPNITQNGFWQIALDRVANVPVWRITPTPANLNLFTAGESLADAPGPVLNLYLMDIVSGLPIDPANPQTLIYFQWNNFPGFNDGVSVSPLQKTPLTISPFQGKVVRTIDTVTLELNWETCGAAYCRVTGDSEELNPCVPAEQPYTRLVSGALPPFAKYTLTAIGQDGKTQVSRTISTHWQVNSEIVPISMDYFGNVQISPGGSTLLVPSANGILLYNLDTLVQKPVLGRTVQTDTYTVAPNGSALYLMDKDTICLYDLANLQAAPLKGADITRATMIRVSPRSSTVAVIAIDLASMSQAASFLGEDHIRNFDSPLWKRLRSHPAPGPALGANQLCLLESATLQPRTSPIKLSGQSTACAVGPQTGNYYVATIVEKGIPFCGQLSVYESYTGQLVGDPMSTDGIGAVALSPDENSLYTLSTIGSQDSPTDSYLSKIDLKMGSPPQRIAIAIGFSVPQAIFSQVPLASLALSPDGAYLFLCGIDLKKSNPKSIVFTFAVFDTATMQPVGGPMPTFSHQFPFALMMSPDGSRLIATTPDGPTDKWVNSLVYAIDPVFD